MTRHLVLLVATASLANTASGTLVLEFDQTSASINVGDTINANVFLVQTDPAAVTDIRSNSLLQADIELSLSATAASVTNLSFGAGFSDTGLSDLSAPGSPLLSADGGFAGVLAGAGSPTAIHIGSFEFTGLTPGATTVSFVDSPFLDFLFETDPTPGGDIDSLIFSGSSPLLITVTDVPELSPAPVLACLYGLIAMRVSRRRGGVCSDAA